MIPITKKEINTGKLLARLEGDEDAKAVAIQAVAKADITQDIERALNDCISCVLKENRDEELKELSLKLKKAQETNNDKAVMELVARINKIHKEKVT